jgi:hypothetical protein
LHFVCAVTVSELLGLHVLVLHSFATLFGLRFQELLEASSQQLPACELKLVQPRHYALFLCEYD